jgi:hypothetical protein
MSYGVLFDGFWTGPTGKAIARTGGSAAQLVALYLMGNQDANMIGLYPLRLPVARERLGTLSTKALERSIAAINQAEFADYDTKTEYVWVREMARYRLNLHDNNPLEEKDRRRIGAVNMYRAAKPNPFTAAFFEKYRRILRLPKPPAFEGVSIPITSPLVSPTRSVVSSQSQEQSQEQGTENRQVDQNHRAAARDAFFVLVRLAHDVLKERGIPGPADSLVDYDEDLKISAARKQIPYEGQTRKALEAAIAQAEKARRTA